MKTYPIIFLDIDGVLNTLNHLKFQKSETGAATNKIWSPIACKHISLLCKHYDARIVITSSWRHEYSMDDLYRFFESNDISAKYIVDRTPSNAPQTGGENYCRGHEINHWLKKRLRKISSYVIIDDEESMLKEQEPHLVRVDKKTGFSTKEAVTKASKILEIKI
ncbi:MAG TPA: HAD domain-containing protein [Gracilimonas sp.]|uniref:HAD domain-containing protein n=1 Tax=Gracilimonas sp. TaxID=1974203 RepID=UPI002D9A4352|nr:HAD domain-containing protein [Gracilimonas sp.]